EPRLAADAEMVAAMAADLEMRRQLAMKQHLLAARAFAPQIVRHVLAGEGADLRQHVIGQPVHAPPIIAPRGSQIIVISPGPTHCPAGRFASKRKPSFSYKRIAGRLSACTDSQTSRRLPASPAELSNAR